MKRIALGLIAAAALAAPLAAQNTWGANVTPAPPRGGAAGNIAATAHNLNNVDPAAIQGGTVTTYNGEICVYCHTPHAATTKNLPLWNRTLSSNVYTMYFPAGARPNQLQPGPTSLSCLGCHDGTIALDQVANTGIDNPPASGGGKMAGMALIGTDLSGSHPIGIDYPVSNAPGFNPVANVGNAGLRLYTRAGGDGLSRVECASCHDPHTNAQGNHFERIANTGSALCLACHLK